MDIDIAAIEKRAAEATAGPWTTEKPGKDVDGWTQGLIVAAVGRGQGIYATPPGGSFPEADRRFIAHARADIPALLAERADLIEALDKCISALQQHHDDEDCPADIIHAVVFGLRILARARGEVEPT